MSHGDERAVAEGFGGQSDLGASKIDNRLLQKRSTGLAGQSSANPQPLRRSKRIAALQKAKKDGPTRPTPGASRMGRAKVPPSARSCGVAKSMEPAKGRRGHKPPIL